MGESMKRLCTICARGGSKGVKGKNLRILQGKPLIAHSILQALESKLFDAVAVSSDSDEILETAKQYGVQVLVRRPDEMATDTAPKAPAIAHCLTEAERMLGSTFDVLVDLDATSPLRLVEDIVGAVALLESTGVSNVITGAPARRSPYFNLVELSAQGFVELSKAPPAAVVRRQDSPRCFDMNASIYVWRRDVFVVSPKVFYADTKLFEMPEDRSQDIDSELDFQIVNLIMDGRNAVAN
jgi:N-acylneuraminate cytidylyltransferase/CMP-N,N'-diacetyllegionaminic acid synthase